MKADADSALSFDWPRRERFPYILFGCVFLSLAAHVGSFFIFQIVYPQRVTIPPPAPQVALLTPSSPENIALLRWIDAEDPALVAGARSVVPEGLLDLTYKPSYQTVRTQPRGSTEEPIVVRFPAARDSLGVIESALPRPAPTPAAIASASTSVRFAGGLAQRPLQKPASFPLKSRVPVPVEPLRALIGVTAQGAVDFAFLQSSSGNQPLDGEVLAQLRHLRFITAESPITWGFAIVSLGPEVIAAPAQP